MQLGLVVGHAVTTVKHASMQGWRLLVVQMVSRDGKPDGEPVLVIDSLGAGIGTRVLASNEGGGARQLMNSKTSPVRWFVMGIVD